MTAIAYSSNDARLFFLEERKVLLTFRRFGVVLPRRGEIITVTDGTASQRLKVLRQISARRLPSHQIGRRAHFEPRFVCEVIEPTPLQSMSWAVAG